MKFQELKTILKSIKSQSTGTDLFTHMQNVMSKLIQHFPTEAFEKLEEVSYLLKNADSHQLENYLKVSDFRNYRNVCDEMDAYITEMRYQFGAKKPVADGEDEDAEPEEAPPVGFVPDLIEDSQMYQWAGVGFG